MREDDACYIGILNSIRFSNNSLIDLVEMEKAIEAQHLLEELKASELENLKNFLSSVRAKRPDLDFKSFQFESVLVQEADLMVGQKRLLEVDKRLVIPLNLTVRFIITSYDVLHAWSVPELGIKIDAVPGRLNQFVTLAIKPGLYYGQCSELCGVAHGFMPIVVQVVPYDDFLTYLGY